MQSPHGVFLVLEGSDGSGKGTQFEMLKKRLTDSGYDIEVFDFPRYDKPSSHFIRRYLNGDYGPATSISPYTASLFFALDRFEASADIRAALDAGKVVLSNRYVGSNMAHQGSKFADTIEKRSFFVWEDSLEFQLLNIPRPNISLFLRVPAETSYELIKQKAARSYTDKSHDEHEADIEHLRKSVQTYDLLCQLFPKDFKAIDCAPNGDLLPIDAINSKIWDAIQPYLPHLTEPEAAEPIEPDAAADEKHVSPVAPEADSFEWQVDKLSLHALIELAKLGLPITFDWQSGWSGQDARYDFYTPEGLDKDQQKAYRSTYAKTAEAHKHIYKTLREYLHTQKLSKSDAGSKAADLSRGMIPMGAIFKGNLKLDKQEVSRYLSRVRSSALPEVQRFGEALARQIAKTWPETKLDDTASDDTSSPQAINEILAELGNAVLPHNLAGAEAAKLLEATPKNEFDLLADGLYSYSDLSRGEILSSIEKWDYPRKAEALTRALKATPQILDTASYRFDALADRAALAQLVSKTASPLKVQQPTVRYGYELQPEVEKAHLEDSFTEVSDSFLELFGQLESTDETRATDYATLVGHKVRWQGVLSGSNLKALADDRSQASIQALIAAAAEVHPIVGEFLADKGVVAKSKSDIKKPRRRGGKSKK